MKIKQIQNNNLDERTDYFFKICKNSYNVYSENKVLEGNVRCKL